MADHRLFDDGIDWELTTFDGARREAMRRWAELPLERVIAALEEMESITRALAEEPSPHPRRRDDASA